MVVPLADEFTFIDVVPTVADVVALYVNVTVHVPVPGLHDWLLPDVNVTPVGNVPTVTVTGTAAP